jgi:peroxiredoxin
VALFFAIATSAAASPIGKRVEPFTLPDSTGAERKLEEWRERKVLVLVFVSADCPVVKRYAPRLEAMAKEFADKGVAFVGVLAAPDADRAELERFRTEHRLSFPILVDPGSVLATQVEATRTPEAFVLDGERIIRYHGRIDGQYQPGIEGARVERRDLAEAIGEVLAGKTVRVPETEPAGCIIEKPASPASAGKFTYTRDVAPILNKRCIGCHRAGQAAPFVLTGYKDVEKRQRRIRESVAQGRMPPWLASPEFGHFKNDSRLHDDERKVLFDWIDSGAPEGDPRDRPPTPVFPDDDWRIPYPDHIVSMPEAFTIPASGAVDYQYYEVDPGFTEDKWIQMAEVRPSNRAVVHHGLVYLRPPGSNALIAQGDLKSLWLAGVGPNSPPVRLPEGRAKRIPAGWKLVFQMHYVPVGSVQTDRTSIGLVFADPKTVKQEVATNMALNPDVRVEPYAANQRVVADHEFPQDVLLLSLNPHMHLRGKSFRFEAVYPDGGREVLLDVPRFDFNWQNTYILEEPKRLPKGTVMHCTAVYDNSRDNPYNPDPSATVTWGASSEDEMMIGYFDIVRADQDLTSWRQFLSDQYGRFPPAWYAAAVVAIAAVFILRWQRRRQEQASVPA